jgi:hypothetical protein
MFSLGYHDAHRIVEKLLQEKKIVFSGGIEYRVCANERKKQNTKSSSNNPFKNSPFYRDSVNPQRRNSDRLFKDTKVDDDTDDDDVDDDDDKKDDDNSDFLEERYKEIIARRRAELEERRKKAMQQRQTNADNKQVTPEFMVTDMPEAFITESNVRSFLSGLIKADLEMTRHGAINKVQELVSTAIDKGFITTVRFLDRVLDSLNSYSDYQYKKLRESLIDDDD